MSFFFGTERKAETFAPAFYLIGELAEMTGLSPGAIRFYERLGLLEPRRHGRFRTYAAADTQRLSKILQLRRIGLPLKEIRKIIDQVLRPGNEIDRRLKELALRMDEKHGDGPRRMMEK